MKIKCFKVSVIGALGVVVFSSSVHANNGSELLKKTITDASSRFSGLQFQPLDTHLSGLDAWIDKSEVNWSNKDLSNFEDQKISYELQFKNRAQIKAEQALLNMGQNKVALKVSSYLEKQLNYKYKILIDVIAQRKQQRLLQQQHALARGELNSWKLKINSDDFRADKLQQADLTLDNIWGEMLQNGARSEQLERHDMSQKNLSNSEQKIPTVRQIIRTVNSIMQSGQYQQYNQRIKAAELEILETNRKQQRYAAQKKLSFKSLKVEYDNKGEDFGVSMGIRVPITKNNFDRLEEKQALHFKHLEAQNLRLEVSDQLSEKRNQLIQLSNLWESNQKLLKKLESRMSRLATTQNIDLRSALSNQKIKLVKRKNSIEINALQGYVGFLREAGMLASKPYRNWLQAGTPVLF